MTNKETISSTKVCMLIDQYGCNCNCLDIWGCPLSWLALPFYSSTNCTLQLYRKHFFVVGLSEQVISINMVAADIEMFSPVVELKTTLSRKHRPDYF